MKTLATSTKTILTLAAAGAILSGCMVERGYAPTTDSLDVEAIAGVRGSAGRITDFDQTFTTGGVATDMASADAWTAGSAYVERYEGQVFADLVVQDQRGNVYVNVEIVNPERMEIGQPYEVAFDRGEGIEPGATDEPAITVYACPDDPSEDRSGQAETLTVVLEEVDARGGQHFSFTADAPNERQQLAMDGFVVARQTVETVGY